MSNHVANIPSYITCEYLQKLLQNIFDENSINIKNYQVTPGSSVGDNYVCQVLRIHLEYKRKNQKNVEKLSVIAKIFPETEIAKEVLKTMDVNKIEVKMMSETLPLLYKELLSKNVTGPFFPHVYQSDTKNGVTFMEDLKADGFVMVDRKSSLDLDHSLLFIKALAKMHASSYLFLQKNPDYKNDFLDVFWKRNDGAFPEKTIDGCYIYFLKFLDSWPISEEDKAIFRSFEGKLMDIMTESYNLRENSFNALLHGDPWMANMMFKYQDGKVSSVKLFDYQVSNYSSIALDIIYFLFTSAMEYVKTEHLDDIFQVYYDTFVSVTGKVEGFSLDTVKNEFSERLGFGLVLAATFRCMMTAEEGFDLDAFLENREAPENDKMFSSKKFISEFVNLLPMFKKHGVFELQH